MQEMGELAEKWLSRNKNAIDWIYVNRSMHEMGEIGEEITK